MTPATLFAGLATTATTATTARPRIRIVSAGAVCEGVVGGCIPSPLAALVTDLGGPDDPIAGEFETVDKVACSTTGTMRSNGLPRTLTRIEAPARARATAFEGL